MENKYTVHIWSTVLRHNDSKWFAVNNKVIHQSVLMKCLWQILLKKTYFVVFFYLSVAVYEHTFTGVMSKTLHENIAKQCVACPSGISTEPNCSRSPLDYYCSTSALAYILITALVLALMEWSSCNTHANIFSVAARYTWYKVSEPFCLVMRHFWILHFCVEGWGWWYILEISSLLNLCLVCIQFVQVI